MEYWVERYEILSPTQYGFYKGRGTKDCVVLLLTAIQSSFERKQQTLVGFLDISGAYCNVLIDILCEQMHQAQLPLKIVKVMTFCDEKKWFFTMRDHQWRSMWGLMVFHRDRLSVHFLMASILFMPIGFCRLVFQPCNMPTL
jgi:hypothetical protein